MTGILAKTKTYKYLYTPMSNIFFTDSTRKLFNTLDIVNVYLGLSSDKENIGKKLYILVNTDNVYFTNILEIQKTSFYLDHYSANKEQVIIVIKMFGGRSYDKFMESKYSEMYMHSALSSIKNRIPDKDYKVLTGDDGLRTEIYNLFYEPTESKEVIQELDSRVKIEEEIYH